MKAEENSNDFFPLSVSVYAFVLHTREEFIIHSALMYPITY